MKTTIKAVALWLAVLLTLTACGGGAGKVFDATKPITVVTREDGSGTRDAFVSLFNLNEDCDGDVIDATTTDAVVVNNTAVMMATIQGNPYAIGYTSLGALNDTVKAVKIDGVPATAETIQDGRYQVARPFIIAVQETLSPAAEEFIGYILSQQGQQVVKDEGYVSIKEPQPNIKPTEQGKVVVAGSSSVAPLMEKLKEAYETLNPEAEVEIQQNDSSVGISSVVDGISDIGMASRGLKDSELEKGLQSITIAIDGIVVVVNHKSPYSNLSSTAVHRIFKGQDTTWQTVEAPNQVAGRSVH